MKGHSKKRKRDMKGVLGSGVKESDRTHDRERGAARERRQTGGRHGVGRGERPTQSILRILQ